MSNIIPRVAAIHDMSGYGKCSLTVALPILSAAGVETAVIPTAVLSTHTGGFTGFTYRDLTDDLLPVAEHWKSLELPFDAMYSGFLGSSQQIELMKRLFDMWKPSGTLILVDPVMADNGQLYAIYSPEMARGMAGLCAHADIIAPNLTEAAFLLDEPYVGEHYDRPYIEGLMKRLISLGAPKVVLTGISFEPGMLGAACYDSADGCIGYFALKLIDGYFHGTGDVFGSSLLSGLLSGQPLTKAMETAVKYTHRCITLTVEAGLERRYGVCFEKAIPYLIELLK